MRHNGKAFNRESAKGRKREKKRIKYCAQGFVDQHNLFPCLGEVVGGWSSVFLFAVNVGLGCQGGLMRHNGKAFNRESAKGRKREKKRIKYCTPGFVDQHNLFPCLGEVVGGWSSVFLFAFNVGLGCQGG